MEIRQLRSFRVVANLLSFNKAADRLHYAQSTVSAQIHLLEQELGADLFERLGKNVQLTETGAQLLQYANKILDLVDETASALTGNKEPVGSLTVRIPESFGGHRLPDVIRKFHSKFPKVRLSFITCSHEDLARDLRKGITDLAFLLTESIAASDILTETLGFEKVVLVVSPGHPLAARRTVRTRDLAGETILLSKVDCSYRKTFEQILGEEGLSPSIIEFYSIDVIKRTLMAGVGVTVLPKIAIAEEVARKQLVMLPWSEGEIEVAILMVWYRDKWLSPTLQAFMDVTRRIMARSR